MKKATISILITLAAVAIIAIFVWPSFEELKVKKENIAEKQQQVKELSDYISQLNDLSWQINGSQDQLAKINQALLAPSYLPSVFQLVQAASSSSGVIINKVQLGKETPLQGSKDITGQEVKISLSGDYLPVKNFLMFIERNSRLIAIESISLNKTSASQAAAKNKISTPTVDIAFKVFSYIQNNLQNVGQF